MDWNALKTFISVAETGTLSAAAKQLGVNHSTVYRRLQQLEQDIGIKLLSLQGTHYSLTAAGEEFLSIGLQINEKYNDLERLVVGKAFQPRGLVRITAPFNISNRFLPAALKPCREDHPDIAIEILSSNQDVNMNSRIADIAVRATQAPPGHLIGRKIASFEWGAFASEAYLEKHASIPITSLSEHSLIGAAGHMLSLPAFIWLEKQFSEQISVRCDELTAMSYFAEMGQGIALLPMDQKRPGIKCLMTLKNIPASDIWLLTHPDLKNAERIRVVMKYISEYFANLQAQAI